MILVELASQRGGEAPLRERADLEDADRVQLLDVELVADPQRMMRLRTATVQLHVPAGTGLTRLRTRSENPRGT